jgi:hypothetical protein
MTASGSASISVVAFHNLNGYPSRTFLYDISIDEIASGHVYDNQLLNFSRDSCNNVNVFVKYGFIVSWFQKCNKINWTT